MNKDFFKNIRILDGGMGQQLLAKGLISKGTLWSATANLDKNFHDLVVDVHLSFINAGSEVILTNTFAARKIRLIQNKVEDLKNNIQHLNYFIRQNLYLWTLTELT